MFMRNDFSIHLLKLSRILDVSPQQLKANLESAGIKEIDKKIYAFNDLAKYMRDNFSREELSLKVHAFLQKKGGVGKSSNCYNIGMSLALLGYKVLFIDLDPQANISTMLAFTQDTLMDTPNTLKEALMETMDLRECIHPVAQNVDLIPGNARISDAANHLTGKATGVHIFEKLFKKSNIREDYDFIVFDNNSASSIISDAALVVSDSVVSVTMPEQNSLDGLAPIEDVIEDVREGLGKDISWRVLLNNFDINVAGERELAEETYKEFGENVFRNYIKKSADFNSASRLKLPFLCFSSFNSNALKDYQSFINEFIEYMAGKDTEISIHNNNKTPEIQEVL